MKVTTEILKQIIKEELFSFLQEGKKAILTKEGPIVIYYDDEDPNPDEPNDDIAKGEKAIVKQREERGVDQSVPLDSSDPDFARITAELSKRGYDFKVEAGVHMVKVPGSKTYVRFILRYGRTQKN
jgi:hypothetical protein